MKSIYLFALIVVYIVSPLTMATEVPMVRYPIVRLIGNTPFLEHQERMTGERPSSRNRLNKPTSFGVGLLL